VIDNSVTFDNIDVYNILKKKKKKGEKERERLSLFKFVN